MPWFQILLFNVYTLLSRNSCGRFVKHDVKLRRGEELETGFPWFCLALSLTQRENVFNEQTLLTIYYLIESNSKNARYPVKHPSWSGWLSHQQYIRAIQVHSELVTKGITVQFQLFNFEQLYYRFLSHQRQFSFKCKHSKGL